MIFLCGDTHGLKNLGKVIKFFETQEDIISKKDLLIILGDCAAVWDEGTQDREVRRMLKDLPCSVAYLDGNHENFDALNKYPETPWNGGMVHMIDGDEIVHLIRGNVYEIQGKRIFVFGGGYSYDKQDRTQGISWWPEEMPSSEEYLRGKKALERVGYSVDYILAHTAPREVVAEMNYELDDEELELRCFLQNVVDNTDFEKFYFGHFHEDVNIEDTYIGLWDEIIELELE